MQAIEIARRLDALGQTEDALQAYRLALSTDLEPTEKMEAAAYNLQHGGDYRVSYTCFRELYNGGFHQEDVLAVMETVFYEPNVSLLKNRYERNCRRLAKYPYLFRKDFLAFEDLPIRFFPYDDRHGYVPFYSKEKWFGDFVNVRDQVVSRNFFENLDDPILATDVFSQYELEYLNDNVRKSEDVGRENHIYLHYTDWSVFCAWLQVLSMKPLTESEKAVFLIEDEVEQYPIDFQERFGIDYSRFQVRPVALNEYNRLIWHTQLSTHNGGDFFNEIFDGHPNLIALPSVMMSSVAETIEQAKKDLKRAGNLQNAIKMYADWDSRLVAELYSMKDPSDKDYFVTMYLNQKLGKNSADKASRIVPALFFQPHFSNIVYKLHVDRAGRAVLHSDECENIRTSPIFRGFKYIKTFTPMRRFTTSHGATVKYMYNEAQKAEDGETKTVVGDAIMERVLNRSFMIDPEDRLYRDSVLVRFEDGKLNPKATFTALAAFLDLPYDESMTVCSEGGKPVYYLGGDGYAPGFNPQQVFKTYDEYVNNSERYFIEYFLRDAYEYYGYGFQYYDGVDVDKEKCRKLISGFDTINHYMEDTWIKLFLDTEVSRGGQRVDERTEKDIQRKLARDHLKQFDINRINNAEILLRGLRFVNKNGQPLRMMPKLELDPSLLEQPLYH